MSLFSQVPKQNLFDRFVEFIWGRGLLTFRQRFDIKKQKLIGAAERFIDHQQAAVIRSPIHLGVSFEEE